MGRRGARARPLTPVAGLTFDTGALVAIERGSLRMQALLDYIDRYEVRVTVPAGVLGQAWRGHPRQARLARFLRGDLVEVAALDEETARAAGVLCGQTGTADVVDASVVLCARERGHPTIITSDPDDLHDLDPAATIRTP
jgi:predicted nucleic acid-binding protein